MLANIPDEITLTISQRNGQLIEVLMCSENSISRRNLPKFKPTVERFFRLAQSLRKISLTRALQYEILDNYYLNGDVLDFGGGEKSLYRGRLLCNSYTSVNIDPSIFPTWIVSVGGEIPCDKDIFDTVLSLNTLEHMYDPIFGLRECYRVLKPGGDLLLSAPFLYPVHGHPDDFFRPTASWFNKTLEMIGFKNIEVIPLAWGPFSVGAVCSGLPGPAKLTRKIIALFLDLIYQKSRSNHMEKYATAFFVKANK